MLKIKALEKTYRDSDGSVVRACVIDKFNISEGDMLGLKGVSGSGKSTLLNMIAGIVLPTAGEINFHDENIVKLSENMRDEWRTRNIGYIFQTMNLIEPLTVIENVAMPAIFATRGTDKNINERACALLGSIGLAHKAKSKPNELSTGERQRVAVARALINEPALILADEPTASLDEENAATVINILIKRCLSSKTALIVASHDAKVLSNFSDVFLLERH